MKKDDPRSGLRSMFIPHERVYSVPEGESKTRQEFVDECDINKLMERYDKAGMFPAPDVAPRYLDVSNVPNLQDAMAVLIEAEGAFMSLPAKVRREFDNDSVKFVEFASDPANLDKMREWGLAPPEKAPEEPMRVRVVPDPSLPAAAADGSVAPGAPK